MTSSFRVTAFFAILGFACADFPENPCPKYVAYRNNPSEGRVAVITVRNDYSGKYEMTVKSSLQYVTKETTNLEMVDYEDLGKKHVRKLVFLLQFGPKEGAFPKITSIVYNGKMICESKPYPISLTGVTNMQSNRKANASFQKQFAKPKKAKSRRDVSTTARKCGAADDSEPGFPWMAAIFVYRIESKNYEFVCTTTLISDRHVITAARCVQTQNALDFDVDDLVLVFGKPRLDNWVQKSVLGYVDKVTVHPKHEQDATGYDLAILTLSDRLKLSEKVSPVCLEGANSVPKAGIVSGWGSRKNQVFSVNPYRVSLPVVEQEECKKNQTKVTEGTFCAGVKEGNGPCGKDVGAGFTNKANGIYHLLGIASQLDMNDNTCTLSNYVVFTNTTKEINWINSVIN